MAKDLTNAEDTEEALASQDSGGSRNITIDEGKTPVYILTKKYEFGHVHWVDLPGRKVRVICAGGKESGFVPDDCAICGLAAGFYSEAKKLEKAKKTSEADKVKAKGNDIRAKWMAEFIIAKGELVKIKRADGLKEVPDFDDCEVGVLSMTQRQYDDLVELSKDERYPYIAGGADLINRILLLDKAKRKTRTGKKSRFATTEIRPAKRATDPPVDFDDLENKEELLEQIEADFKVDTEAIDRVYGAYTAEDVGEAGEDEEFETEAADEEGSFDLSDEGLEDGFELAEEEEKPKKKTSSKR